MLGKPLDERTDSYSFGVVRYEMATGYLSFTGDRTGAVFSAILHDEASDVERLNEQVPQDLGRIIKKAREGQGTEVSLDGGFASRPETAETGHEFGKIAAKRGD